MRALGFPAKSSCFPPLGVPSALASIWSPARRSPPRCPPPSLWHARSVPVQIQHHPSGFGQTEALGVILDKGTHVCEPQCPLHKRGIIAPIYRDMCWNSGKKKTDWMPSQNTLGGHGRGFSPWLGWGWGATARGKWIPNSSLETLQRNGTVAPSRMGVTVAAPCPLQGSCSHRYFSLFSLLLSAYPKSSLKIRVKRVSASKMR